MSTTKNIHFNKYYNEKYYNNVNRDCHKILNIPKVITYSSYIIQNERLRKFLCDDGRREEDEEEEEKEKEEKKRRRGECESRTGCTSDVYLRAAVWRSLFCGRRCEGRGEGGGHKKHPSVARLYYSGKQEGNQSIILISTTTTTTTPLPSPLLRPREVNNAINLAGSCCLHKQRVVVVVIVAVSPDRQQRKSVCEI